MSKRRKGELNGVADLYLLRQLAEKNTPPDDDAFREKYPKLFSILSDVKISDDQVIDPPILSLKNSAGDWCLSLSVPGLRMYGEVLSGTFLDVLDATEQRLAGGTFPWKVNVRKGVTSRKVKAKD